MSVDEVLINRSYQKLREQSGGSQWLRRYLGYNSWDMTEWEDDFNASVIETTYRWPAGNLWNSGGAGAADLAMAANSSTATMVSGTTDNGVVGATFGKLMWYGQNDAVCAARVHLGAAVANAKIEFGFTDDIEDDAGILNDGQVTTPTWTAGDGAAWTYDTDATDATTVWQHHAVAATVGDATTKTVTTLVPVASTYQRLVVALKGTSSRYLLLDATDALQYDSGWKAYGVTTDTALIPALFVTSRATTTKTLTIDQIQVWQRRSIT